MIFRHYDALRIFNIAASHLSFTKAANELSLTKGAISYQIKQLEQDLGFILFERQHGRVELTTRGKRLWQFSNPSFQQFESEISQLKHDEDQIITIGMSTYFASRWLTPRLMSFISEHPNIGLRLQPTVNLIDLKAEKIDMAIRWGDGKWGDVEIEKLFNCPAKVTAGKTIAEKINNLGLGNVLQDITLLHDREDSSAWKQWHDAAGFNYQNARSGLVIPDPNVRVQAVINGQGLALNDELISDVISRGDLFQVSPIELKDFGYYLAYPKGVIKTAALKAFHDWILNEAR